MKVRCSNQLHEICYDGKSWYAPDCSEERLVLNALAYGSGKSKCTAFMEALHSIRGPSDARWYIDALGIGNKELQREFVNWAYQREQKYKSRRDAAYVFRESGQERKEVRYLKIAQTKLLGWMRGIYYYFGPVKSIYVRLDDFRDVNHSIALWSYKDGTVYIAIPSRLVKQMGPEKAYFENGIFYFPTREGYKKYTAKRSREIVVLTYQGQASCSHD